MNTSKTLKGWICGIWIGLNPLFTIAAILTFLLGLVAHSSWMIIISIVVFVFCSQTSGTDK